MKSSSTNQLKVQAATLKGTVDDPETWTYCAVKEDGDVCGVK